jgi:hypothetical protein
VFRFSGALPQVTFTWAPSGEAQEYRVVLATGPDLLEQALQSTEVRGQRAQLQPPDAGEYWWGVYQGGAAQAADGTLQPIFAKPRRLRVVKVAKPRADVPRSITRWGD